MNGSFFWHTAVGRFDLNLILLRTSNKPPCLPERSIHMQLENEFLLPYNMPTHGTININILSNGNRYYADIQTPWSNWYRFPLELTQHDLEDLNLVLQQAIRRVSDNFRGHKVLGDHLIKLAEEGNTAFNWIFSDDRLRKTIIKVLKAGMAIEFSTEDFFIPWELLYDGPLDTEIDASYFWGMRHVISRALIVKNYSSDLGQPPTQSLCPRVGLIACNELEHVVGKEIPALYELHRQKQIEILPLRPLDAKQHDAELKHFGRFLCEEELQIVHLACHAYADESPSRSYLLIADDFPITIGDFRRKRLEIKHHPLVILNPCLTGTINPLYTSNWAILFWERGARGVLATEFYVPDGFAAEFVEEFYKFLLLGMPIGKALLATRRHFWEKQRNPLGLAYALYARSFIKIIQGNTSE